MEGRRRRLREEERLMGERSPAAPASPAATRRQFLKLTAVSAGGLALGVRLASPRAAGTKAAAGTAAPDFRPNAWVRIDPSGKVFLTVGKSEMGQGARTSLPMILADELGVDPDSVELVQARPGPDFQDLGTYGSRSTRTMWAPLRAAGAAAREMLVAAAAARWGVDASSCRAEGGEVRHSASGRSARFGELAAEAARLPVPSEPRLRPKSELRLIGRDRRRVDAPRIVAGQAVFASDVRLPGMKVAAILRSPVHGGEPKSWDESAARAVPGFVAVAKIPAGVALVAEHSWAALQAREALEKTVVWSDGENGAADTASLTARLKDAASRASASLRRGGDASAALASAARRIEAEYYYPLQAHAPLEPMSAVADVRRGSCEVWAGTQNPNGAHEAVAKALGLDPSAVTVNVTLLGGGFGRRGRSDFVLDAVEASRAVGAPVKVLWTREDDMRVGDFHPVSYHLLAAGLDGSGAPVAWRHRVAAVSWARGGSPPAPSSDEQLRPPLRGAYDIPYAIPAVEAALADVASPVRVSSWRGVNHNHNVFAAECFADEVAAAAGKDPFAFRLALLKTDAAVAGGREGKPVDRARLAAVLELAGRKAGWGTALPAGRARGVACAAYDGQTSAAVVAEVTVSRDGTWRTDRVVCAVDPGVAVNPLGIRAQVEGSVAWAMSALSTEITLKAGRVQQGTYRDFPILRFRDMPRVETFIVDSDAPPTGMGEPPVPVTTAAVANALSAASGRRVRRLPLRAADLKGA
jgi:isoquinoline 1-oxidoreductase beta subunit